MVSLATISSVTTKAGALSNLVLAIPQAVYGYQPQNPPNADGTISEAPQPPALMFTYEGENTVILESDITDHYVEDNTARQDQIALKPEVITVHGYVGELNDVPPFALSILKIAADRLTAIGSYAPGLSTTALVAYQRAFYLYQVAANVANSAVAAWDSVSDLVSGGSSQSTVDDDGFTAGSTQNAQQKMFGQFYGYWRERRLFSVQTPWAVFLDMAIKSLRAIQDPETQQITDFEVSFKRIRTASTETTGEATSLQGRAASQAAGLKDFGASSGTPSQSLSSGISGMGG